MEAHPGVAVATIRGDRVRDCAAPLHDGFDGWGELVGIGRVAHLVAVVHDNPVDVVDDLGFVAELAPVQPEHLDASHPGVRRHVERRGQPMRLDLGQELTELFGVPHLHR